MATALDQIVQVRITADQPPIDTLSFSNLCLIGPAPGSGEATPPAVFSYQSLKDVSEAGWGEYAGETEGEVEIDPIYRAAQVAFAQNPAPSRIVIAQYESGTSLNDALEAALEYGGWYGICPVGLSETEIGDLAAWVNGQERIATLPFTDGSVSGDYYRCAYIYTGGEDAEGTLNEYIHVAYMAKFLSYRPGSEAWENKALNLMKVHPLRSGDMSALEAGSVSYYLTVAGRNIVRGGKTSGNNGEWIDVVRFKDWLKNDIQLRVFSLMLSNPKLPFTDDGINMVRNQMEAALLRGQEYGGVAPDEYDADGNMIPGFKISVPLAVDIGDDKKAARILEDCRFSARLAGAIRIVEIFGELTYGLDAEE